MSELIYEIDAPLSSTTQTLAIRIRSRENNGQGVFTYSKNPLSNTAIQKLAKDQDKQAIALLCDVEKYYQKEILKKPGRELELIDGIAHIPYRKSQASLKVLASTGRLFFNQLQLACDFFGKVEFFYSIQSKTISGKLKKDDSPEIDIHNCDFICGGPPHFYIKGIILRFIATDISWKDLKSAYEKNLSEKDIPHLLEDQEDPDAPRVILQDQSQDVSTASPTPYPFLKLVDKHGGFAQLWMKYGENHLVHYPDRSKQTLFKRNLEQEKLWEQDLLETDFILKFLPNSEYYCPLDKVAKSLTFLLEIGWTIEDWEGSRILNHAPIHLEVDSSQNRLFVRGKVHYETHEVNLSTLVGAFNRREKFIQIVPGIVGLMPTSLPQGDLEELFQEGEIISDAITFKKYQIGTLSTLIESANPSVKSTFSFEKFKETMFADEMEQRLPGTNFKGILRHYQQIGLNWLSALYDLGLHGMLADDMGLGKTVQILAFLSRLSSSHPILIIAPTSLLFNWKKEIETFLPSAKACVYHGSEREKDLLKNAEGIILTSYTTLRIDLAYFLPLEFDVVILDEAQVMKNASTQIAKTIFQLRSHFRLSLTGTPIENHLTELWSHFHFLMPELLGSEHNFERDVQAGISDSRYLARIKKKIRPFILRRMKEEVAKDLPKKIEQTVWIEMEPDHRRVYEAYLSGVKQNLLKKVSLDGVGKHRIEILESILRLRQICCHPLLVTSDMEAYGEKLEIGKLGTLIQDLETVFKENRKALVYSQFTSMLKLIAKVLKQKNWNFVYLDGQTQNRQAVVEQFQSDPELPFFLISLKAGGVGLNLTAADYVFLYDPWWNEAVENQAIDRAHRIGRQNTVIAKRYVMIETVEEKIMKLKAAKNSLVDQILSDEFTDGKLTEDDLLFLLS